MEITRSVTVEVFLSEKFEEKYKAILNSIRHYRAVCRHTYALLFEAHAAGASFCEKDEKFMLKPDNERCKEILALAMNKKKDDGSLFKAPVYEVREYVMQTLAPNWKAFVFDGMRASVYSRWKAPDTEFPKAQRGFMSLQGARGVAQFQRIGISMARQTAKPLLEKHSIFLNWDREIGEIEFKFSKLDSGRYFIWKNITSNQEWKFGTVTLTEIDGKLKIGISYTRPANIAQLEPGNVMDVWFSNHSESYIRMTGPEGIFSYDSISTHGALGGIDELKKKSEYYKERMGAAGSKRKPWGFRKAFVDVSKTLNNVTVQRENQVKDWNHRWTRRIVENAKRWRCSKVVMHGVPKEKMSEHPEYSIGVEWIPEMACFGHLLWVLGLDGICLGPQSGPRPVCTGSGSWMVYDLSISIVRPTRVRIMRTCCYGGFWVRISRIL